MKKRAYIMLGLALLLAAMTVLLAQKFMLSPNKASDTVEVKMTKIVVAKNRLNYGAIINQEHLRMVSWPKEAIPEGAFTSIADMIRRDEHRVVLRRIEKDEPVLKSKISGFGGRASLSAIISPNMRAATIRVNDVNGVAGFVLPGDHVDIMITRDPSGGGSGRRNRGRSDLVTDILLQNVKVLGIDQEADDSQDKPAVAKAVTLEVEPHQAQKLILAQQVGTLSLALRNVNNSEKAQIRTITLRDLRVGEMVKKKSKSRVRKSSRRRAVVKRRSSVKIIRGLKSSEYDVMREPPVTSTQRPSRTATSEVPLRKSRSGSDKSASSSITAPDKGHSLDRSKATRGPVQLYRPPARRHSDQEAAR